MQCLFVDLASHDGVLACVADDSVASFRTVDQKIGDNELIPLAEATLRDVPWTYEDLTHVACVVGPGGFTSLRVAVAFANTLADQLGVPLAGVHLSDLTAARADVADFLWLHSTKKQELFVRGFGSSAAFWPEATLVTMEGFLARAPREGLWAGELLPEHRDIIALRGLRELPLQGTSDVLPSFLAQRRYGKNLLQPWYGRGW